MSPVSDGGGSLEGRGRKGWNSGVGRLARVDANFLYPLPLLQPPTLQEDYSKRLFFSPIGRNGPSGCQRGRPGPSLDPWGDQAQFSSTIPPWWLLSSSIPCYHAQRQLMCDLFLFPSYSQLIAECPVAVLLLCLAFILLCTLAGLLGGQLPDFSKPLLVRGHGGMGPPCLTTSARSGAELWSGPAGSGLSSESSERVQR